jgi:hypothetical protein
MVVDDGRQPYIIFDVLKTIDAVSPVARRGTDQLDPVRAGYSSVFSMGILYINKLIEGPEGGRSSRRTAAIASAVGGPGRGETQTGG